MLASWLRVVQHLQQRSNAEARPRKSDGIGISRATAGKSLAVRYLHVPTVRYRSTVGTGGTGKKSKPKGLPVAMLRRLVAHRSPTSAARSAARSPRATAPTQPCERTALVHDSTDETAQERVPAILGSLASLEASLLPPSALFNQFSHAFQPVSRVLSRQRGLMRSAYSL